MKKLPIQKKELTDFTKLEIDLSQQKQLKGGDDIIVIDDIVV